MVLLPSTSALALQLVTASLTGSAGAAPRSLLLPQLLLGLLQLLLGLLQLLLGLLQLLLGLLQLLLVLEHAWASAVAAWLQLVATALQLLHVVVGCSCPWGWQVAETPRQMSQQSSLQHRGCW
jgi:hypothetical protein